MFHFKRQTLWIMIYVTIPLIIILNSLGPSPENEDSVSKQATSSWSLDDALLDCSGPLCTQSLQNSETVWISAIMQRLPITKIAIPDAIELALSQQGGFVVATLSFQPVPNAISEFRQFVSAWLPVDANVRWLISGPEPAQIEKQIGFDKLQFSGQSIDNVVTQKDAHILFESPVLGDPQQLSFLLWIEVLKQRLADSGVEITWDHRQTKSLVVINTPLPADIFAAVEKTELDPILSAYEESVSQRRRSGMQLHRYGLTSIIYDVPYDLFLNQSQRLVQVTLDSVNQMREITFEQSK